MIVGQLNQTSFANSQNGVSAIGIIIAMLMALAFMFIGFVLFGPGAELNRPLDELICLFSGGSNAGGVISGFDCFGKFQMEGPNSSLKANLHAVELGLNEYADKHSGTYPDCIKAPQFDWNMYGPAMPKNPYRREILGNQLVESCIVVQKKPAYRVATTDSRKFSAPGLIRYFVSKDHLTYALITSRKEIEHDLLGRRYFGSNVMTLKDGKDNYVLHNE